jgi:hypothetical protein
MPKPSTIDWELALNLYNQGLKVPRIAEKLGVRSNTISARAKRHNWAQRRAKAVQAVGEVVQNMVKDRPKSVQERAEKWVEREITRVEKLTDVLDVTPIVPTIQGLREHIEVAAMNGKYGRSTFGLDQQSTNIQVNIGMSGHLASVEPIQDQPIDITSTSAEPMVDRPVEPQST